MAEKGQNIPIGHGTELLAPVKGQKAPGLQTVGVESPDEGQKKPIGALKQAVGDDWPISGPNVPNEHLVGYTELVGQK